MLLIASYIFYGAWDRRFLSLIVFSTLIDCLAIFGQLRRELGGVFRKLAEQIG
jgi:hypothetical protein